MNVEVVVLLDSLAALPHHVYAVGVEVLGRERIQHVGDPIPWESKLARVIHYRNSPVQVPGLWEVRVKRFVLLHHLEEVLNAQLGIVWHHHRHDGLAINELNGMRDGYGYGKYLFLACVQVFKEVDGHARGFGQVSPGLEREEEMQSLLSAQRALQGVHIYLLGSLHHENLYEYINSRLNDFN